MLSLDNIMFGARRGKSDSRREQIVEATLALLANVPLDQLSTRQIAKEIGISQPALFRHFSSRDDLLLAAIESTRASLSGVAEAVLRQTGGAEKQLESLATELLRHLEKTPGLPRLLFANVAAGEGPVLGAIKQLYSMQSSLVAELIRQGQREGRFDASIEARDAATLFVGFLQGLTLTRRLTPRDESFQQEGKRLFALWLRSVRKLGASEPLPNADTERPRRGELRVLDVRPLLEQGIEPLDSVLEALGELGPGGVLKVRAPFRPAPLVALLSGRGYRVSEERVEDRLWTLEIIEATEPEPDDLRELEPPEPLERVLFACSELAPGGIYRARLPRNPRMLIPHLRERGLTWSVCEEPDGSAFLSVFRPQ